MEPITKKTKLDRLKQWYKYLELKKYFISLFWRTIFIPSLIIVVFAFPLAILAQCIVWFFTGSRYLNYPEDLMDWFFYNIWDKTFND